MNILWRSNKKLQYEQIKIHFNHLTFYLRAFGVQHRVSCTWCALKEIYTALSCTDGWISTIVDKTYPQIELSAKPTSILNL